ncbi:hypothetical protein [Spirillospora sp. NPDC047279]|uniref:effector-associated constant component EACC1 n=1 Tax=Spirillospora sp. NPDC047279 TaxID=3155478 RepID=UPI0033F6BE60
MTLVVMVEVSEEGADAVRMDQASRRLLTDLRSRGLDAERAAVRAPEGAKSAAATSLATLLIGLASTSAIGAMVNGIFGWLGPRKGSVKVSCGDRSIELSAATTAERDQLIEWLNAWVEQDNGGGRFS